VVAWDVSNSMESGFCVTALKRALRAARPGIFNTDQGSQFSSEDALQGRCTHQHGRPWAGARQRVHRALVAQREVRGCLSA
jgi:transposase InsO family protein